LSPIVPFTLTIETAAEIISKLAVDTNNIVWIDNCSQGQWEEKVSYLQAKRCLESGEVVKGPTFNKETNCWECEMYRFAAGQDIKVSVVISSDKNELYVMNICDE
jgi:hypothetical protein